ncbi:MAG TPA: YCF48-related protein, partial [Candidatus Kapabacteria bacterium]|nr:YCF48-related protein [Candidatus Kapabacteria bacterium]
MKSFCSTGTNILNIIRQEIPFMRLLRWNVVFFFVMLAGVAFAQNASFQSVFYKPTFNNLRRVGYVDATTMYAIGDGATFIRTTDGGTTFQTFTVSPGNEPLYFIQFTSPAIGVVAGDHGLVGLTTDGGADWITQHIPVNERIVGAGFNTATLSGFAVTNQEKIYTTTNDGLTWITFDPRANNPGGFLDPFVQASYLSSGSYLALTASGTIYKTTNTGIAWDSLTHINNPNEADMYFADDLHGWTGVRGGFYYGYTVDGGNTWSFGQWGGGGNTPIIQNIYFKDNSTGWALSSGPASGGGYVSSLWHTNDGGQTFIDTGSYASIGGSNQLHGIRFDNTGSIGWAVGDAGDIRKSTDGGAHWKELASGVTNGPTLSISFFDDTAGVVCAQNGRGFNYATTDGGATWTRTFGVGENSHTVAMMTSSLNAVTLGNQAASNANGFMTTDGGAHWSSDPVPAGDYTRIYDIDANTLMACGQTGLIITSSDGGAHWKNVSITANQPNL